MIAWKKTNYKFQGILEMYSINEAEMKEKKEKIT